MDEVKDWEVRLRGELDASVREVRVADALLVNVRAGGRRRIRRRRALTALPAAVVVAGGAVWAGVHRSAPPPLVPATQSATQEATREATQEATQEATRTDEPLPTSALGEQAAVDLFYGSGYEYEDAEVLAGIWNVDTWEAKAQGGRWIDEGRELPVQP